MYDSMVFYIPSAIKTTQNDLFIVTTDIWQKYLNIFSRA